MAALKHPRRDGRSADVAAPMLVLAAIAVLPVVAARRLGGVEPASSNETVR